jgi:hypothetical protein
MGSPAWLSRLRDPKCSFLWISVSKTFVPKTIRREITCASCHQYAYSFSKSTDPRIMYAFCFSLRKPGKLAPEAFMCQETNCPLGQKFLAHGYLSRKPRSKNHSQSTAWAFQPPIKRSIAAPKYCLAPGHVPSLPRASFRKWHCKAPMNSKTITQLYMSQNRKPILTARHVEVRRVSEMSNQYWREHGYMCAWHVRLGDEV